MTQDLPDQWHQLAERKGIRPTVRGIAEAAELAPSTVSRLVFQSDARRPSTRTVYAISEALGISASDVLRYAGVPAGELGPYDPPAEAHLLTGKQRKALDDLIRAFATEEPVATITELPVSSQERTELLELREKIAQARADVADWEQKMPDTDGGWTMLRDLRLKVQHLEMQETALSERLLSASSETTL